MRPIPKGKAHPLAKNCLNDSGQQENNRHHSGDSVKHLRRRRTPAMSICHPLFAAQPHVALDRRRLSRIYLARHRNLRPAKKCTRLIYLTLTTSWLN